MLKNNKFFSNIYILILSLIFALAINFFVLDNFSIGDKLKTSITDLRTDKIIADLFLKNNSGTIVLKNSKDIFDLKSMSFSLVYDKKNLVLDNFDSNFGEYLPFGSENDGIRTFVLDFSIEKLEKNSNIFKFDIKETKKDFGNINLINANFEDINGNTYTLSTSGVNF